MSLLKSGIEVKILSEGERTIKVQSVNSFGFNTIGDPIYKLFVLSKRFHKGNLFFNGVCIL